MPQNGHVAYAVVDNILVSIDKDCNVMARLTDAQTSKLTSGTIYPVYNGSGFCVFRYDGIVKFNNSFVVDTVMWFDPADKSYYPVGNGCIFHDKMLTYMVFAGRRGLYSLHSNKIITLNLNTFQFENSILTKSYVYHEISSFFIEQGFVYLFFVEYEGIGSWKNYHMKSLNLYKLDKNGKLIKESHEPATPEFEKMFFENKKITGYYKDISIYDDNVVISGETPRKVNKRFIIKLSTDLKLISAYSFDK